MEKKNTFMGTLLGVVMVIGLIVTMNVIFKNVYTDYQIKKINEKYNYMETEEYKEIQVAMNEKYSR